MNTTELPPTETFFECPLCGEMLPKGAVECTKCDWVPGYQEDEQARNEFDRRDIAAAAMSVVPGGGHFLKGHMQAGIMMLVGVPIVVIFAFAFTMFFGWLLIPAYWIGVAMDAYYRPDLRGLGGMPPDPQVQGGMPVLRHRH